MHLLAKSARQENIIQILAVRACAKHAQLEASQTFLVRVLVTYARWEQHLLSLKLSVK